MKTADIIIALTIHLLIPLAGLIIFLGLIRKMKKEEIAASPTIDLFLIFATYGGLLLLVLTTLLWAWSGMATLGMFYLTLVAPIVMGIIAYRNHKKKEISMYHLWSFKAGLLYYVIAPVILGMLIIIE